MKRVIISGAAGFTGAVLTEECRKRNIECYVLVRPGSDHNSRLDFSDSGLHVIEIDGTNIEKVPRLIPEKCDVFFHLLWTDGKSMEEQKENIAITLSATETAKKCGCRRIVITGSQAEYGVVPSDKEQDESIQTSPITPYGMSKVEACKLSKAKAEEIGIEWVWGRIFSLIGKYEPRGRMLPDLFHSLKDGKEMSLSSCMQNWDYLDVYDAADALIALGEKGDSGEIYNIASGKYRPLREYTERVREIILPNANICYGADPDPFISLQPSVKKIMKDTGWKPVRSFEDSLRDYEKNYT